MFGTQIIKPMQVNELLLVDTLGMKYFTALDTTMQTTIVSLI